MFQIDPAHPMPFGLQTVDQVVADKTASTGYKDSTRRLHLISP
jgi:hypothetical protein